MGTYATDELTRDHPLSATLAEIMAGGRNIEWHAVLSLMEAVGTVTERHNGKFDVTAGTDSVIIERPQHKDIDPQTGGLLGRYIAEERDSLRRFAACYQSLVRARRRSAPHAA